MGRTVLGPTIGLSLDNPPDNATLGCVMDQVFTDTVPRYPEDGSSKEGDGQRSKVHGVSDGGAYGEVAERRGNLPAGGAEVLA
jgi:hypothetical protein